MSLQAKTKTKPAPQTDEDKDMEAERKEDDERYTITKIHARRGDGDNKELRVEWEGVLCSLFVLWFFPFVLFGSCPLFAMPDSGSCPFHLPCGNVGSWCLSLFWPCGNAGLGACPSFCCAEMPTLGACPSFGRAEMPASVPVPLFAVRKCRLWFLPLPSFFPSLDSLILHSCYVVVCCFFAVV